MAAISEIYIEIGGSNVGVVNITSYQDNYSVQVLGTPIENGVVKFDHRVRNPITITVRGQADRAMCGILKGAVKKSIEAENMKDSFCKVYPPDGDAIERMVITNFAQTSTADALNLVGVNITLQEMIEA